MNRFPQVLLVLLAGRLLMADSGVIVASGHTSPDPAVLAIDSMNVRVVIDNGHATVSLREVFHNKTADVLEGAYTLALPGGAAVSDFAVWDDVTRIPASFWNVNVRPSCTRSFAMRPLIQDCWNPA